MTRSLMLHDLGRAVPYPAGFEAMARAAADVDERPRLLFVEHAPVITVTRSHGRAHVKVDDDELARRGVALHEASRGGDVTFHGPGQLVGYPVVRLPRADGTVDVVAYLRALERGLIAALVELGVASAHVEPGLTGVWVGDVGAAARKIASIGVGVSPRGITRHGFSLNVDVALETYTSVIVPCGLVAREMTTLARELGPRAPTMTTVKATVGAAVARALGFTGVAPAAPLSSRTPFPVDGAMHG